VTRNVRIVDTTRPKIRREHRRDAEVRALVVEAPRLRRRTRSAYSKYPLTSMMRSTVVPAVWPTKAVR
jgi:hypothetical protein